MRPVIALIFSSALGTALFGTRVLVSGSFKHLYLIGNLILAWIPWLASTYLERSLASSPPEEERENASAVRHKRWAAAAIWFFFFPNSPYIFTDLVHLGPRYHGVYWIDMLLILLFALTGLVLGFISLRSMQRLVAGRFGWQVGWLFVAGMSLLSGIGIYAGRFLRWNSWDVIARPWMIGADLLHWLFHPHLLSLAFPIVCGLFIFAAYLTIWSLAEEAQKPSNA
jgi:uncharacterized membrane protein